MRRMVGDPPAAVAGSSSRPVPLAPNATFYGIDRDLTCVHMSALNMLMRNADSVSVHGNTLSMETFGGYVTRRTAASCWYILHVR